MNVAFESYLGTLRVTVTDFEGFANRHKGVLLADFLVWKKEAPYRKSNEIWCYVALFL